MEVESGGGLQYLFFPSKCPDFSHLILNFIISDAVLHDHSAGWIVVSLEFVTSYFSSINDVTSGRLNYFNVKTCRKTRFNFFQIYTFFFNICCTCSIVVHTVS